MFSIIKQKKVQLIVKSNDNINYEIVVNVINIKPELRNDIKINQDKNNLML